MVWKWIGNACVCLFLAACRGQTTERAASTPVSLRQPPTSVATATLAPATATLTPSPTLFPTQTPTPTPLPIRLTRAWNSGAIVFMSADGKALSLLRSDGSAPTDLVRLDATDSAVIGWYSIRPNSHDLVYYVAPQDNREPYGEAFLLRAGISRKLTMPSLYAGRWSPDGSKLLGVIYDNNDANNGSAYVYDFALEAGYLLPFSGSADWCPDLSCILFTKSRVLTPDKFPEYTIDLYRYDLLTRQETRLTYLDEAIIEMPNGTMKPDTWIIRWPRFLAATQQIAFMGVPDYAKTGAGMNTFAWYTVPATGLPRGAAPRFLVRANRDITFDTADMRAISSHSHHNSGCSTPDSLGLTHLAEKKTISILRGIARPSGADFDIAGFSWSPDQTQLVFAMSVYTCRTAVERVTLQPYNVYIWDATLDANAPFITVPGFVVEGKNPTWIADDLR